MTYYRPPGFRNLISRNRQPAPLADEANDYYRPPPPPQPVAGPPQSRIARAAGLVGQGLHAVGSAVGAPARGLGLMASFAQEGLAGTPDELSRVRQMGPVAEGGIGSDIFAPTLEAPTAGQIGMEGLGMLSGARLPAIDRPGAVLPVDEDPIHRAIRADPTLGRVMAVAEPTADLGLSFGTDPALGLLGVAGRGGRIARAAERAVGAAIIPGMAEGAYHSGQEFLRHGAEQGYTSPDALRAGTQAGLDAALAGAGIRSAFRRAPRPELLEGEYIPPQEALQSAPRLQIEAPVIDIQGRVVPEGLPGSTPLALPQDLSPSAPLRRQLERAYGTGPPRPPVDPSGIEGVPVEAVPSLVPTPGGSLVRGRVFQGAEPPLPIETAIEQALQGKPGPPRLNDYVAPEALGMQPLEQAVEPNVQRMMRRQGQADREALAELKSRPRADRVAAASEQADVEQVRLAQEGADRGMLARELGRRDQENAALQARLDAERRGFPRGMRSAGPLTEAVQPVEESRIARAAEALAARRAPPVEAPPAEAPRGPDRRQEALSPVVERRLQERRQAIAAERPHYPPEAVEELAQAQVGKERHRLTGLPEREMFDQAVKEGRYRGYASGDGKAFGILNKTHGHTAGDAIIKVLADTIQEAAHPLGVDVYHTGGDEFRLGGADLDTVRKAGAAAQGALRGAVFQHTGADGQIRTIPLPEVDFGYGERFDASDAELGAIKLARKSGAPEPGAVAPEPAEGREPQSAPAERQDLPAVRPEPAPTEVAPTRTAFHSGDRITYDGKSGIVGRPAHRGGKLNVVLDSGAVVLVDDATVQRRETSTIAEHGAASYDAAQGARAAEPAPPEVAPPPALRARPKPLATVGEIVRAKADWNAFPKLGEKSAQRGKAGDYRVSAVDETTGETYLQPVGGGQEVLAAREGRDLSNFEVVEKPAQPQGELPTLPPGLRIGDDGKVWKVRDQKGNVVASHRDYATAVEMAQPRKSVATPQVANEPGTKYVLPSFATGGGSARSPVEKGVAAAAEVAPAPTPAQMEAGNYRKGHVAWNGLDVTIETPKGGTRYGKIPPEEVKKLADVYGGRPGRDLASAASDIEKGNLSDGYATLQALGARQGAGVTKELAARAWMVKDFPAHYGYVKGTEGKDGEHVDVYLGEDLKSERVFVVDQIDPKTKKFDEHKVMLGFDSEAAALKVYDRAFDDGSGPMRRGATTEMPLAEFKEWLEKGDTKAPLAWKRPPVPVTPSKGMREAADQLEGEMAGRKPTKARLIPTRTEGGGIAIRTERVREEATAVITHEDIPWANLSRGERGRAQALLARQESGKITEDERLELDILSSSPMAKPAPAPPDDADLVKRPLADAEGTRPGTAELIRTIAAELNQGLSINNRRLSEMADKAFGGTRGEGKYNPRDAYDAVEAAVNRWVQIHGKTLLKKDPRAALDELRGLTKRLPTQADRTNEQVELQQFSTPPTEAYVAARALAVRPGETVLEPSAGVGGLAVWAEAAGGDVKVNEIAERRRGLLKALGFEPTGVDAENLHDVLPDNVKPTAILMNPPFSSTGGRVKAHKTTFGARHVEQALQRLAPGGRLVAIVGEGMGFQGGTPRGSGNRATGSAFMDWWSGIMDRYNVRANLGVPGGEYGKYGTTFGNQIIVIDKTGPTPGAGMAERLQNVKWGRISSLEEAVDALQGVAADRPKGREDGDARAKGVAPEPRGSVEPDRAGVPERPRHAEAEGGGEHVRPGARRPVGSEGDAGGPPGDLPEGESGARPGASSEGPVPARPWRAADEPGDVASPSARAAEDPSRVAAPEKNAGPVVRETEEGGTFVGYKPAKLATKGLKKHPADVVEAASMAAVEPPDITYRTSLPAEVLSEGRLSDLQYESVLYAGQRHAQELPNGARAGYFIGDGTGVGKGREIAGIVLDNWSQGRKKSLWVSVSRDLLEAARGDLDDVAGKGKIPVRSVNDYPAAGDIDAQDGVVFTTYSSLISKAKGEKGQSRQAQIEKWLGKDGIIVFDEAHKAKNALAAGRAEPTQTGRAVIEIQKNLPGARVVYVSATGATDVRNMAYMTRLGLWAPDAPRAELGKPPETDISQEARGKFAFPGGFNEFLNEVEQGGVGAKEMVSRDLKALGMYTSRSISFKGVEYNERVHELTKDQRGMYDASAKAWQVVLQNIEAAVGITHAPAAARTQAMKRFWGDHQRFFRQVTTAMKMPTIIKEVESALKAGESVIVTLKGTGESKTSEQVSKAAAEGRSLDELDFTPREVLAQMVENAFPTQAYEEVADPNNPGKTIKIPVVRDGKPVVSKEAEALKQKILEGLSDLNLPDNPLDQFVNHFGPDKVAEMTGRKKRLLRNSKTGKTEYVKRSGDGVGSDKVNLHEMEQFQSGKKRIAVISRAASTGISLHASMRAKNQQRRRQIAAELDWSADSEMQTFGRSHRSDQKVPPVYVLVSTDVGGEKRFSSTIARRLASLGALTKGQRDATGGGELSKYNFETPEGEGALENLYNALDLTVRKGVPGIEDGPQTLMDMGLIKPGHVVLNPGDKRDVPRFLNRLLALDVERQSAIFTEFARFFDEQVTKAKEEGSFDEGVADITGTSIRVKGEPDLIHKDETTGAETKHVTLEVDRPITPMTWAAVEKAVSKDTATEAIDTYDAHYRVVSIHPGYYKQARSGNIVYAGRGGTRTNEATGSTTQMMRLMRPKGAASVVPALDVHEKYELLTHDEAEKLWKETVAKIPKTETVEEHIIAGSVLPIWQQIKGGKDAKLQIVRATADDGTRIVGVRIPESEVGGVLQSLGVGRKLQSAEDVMRAVSGQGDTVRLAEGVSLRRTNVHGEPRLELEGVRAVRFDQARGLGLIEERINAKNRFFVPTSEEKGLTVLRKVLEAYPAVGGGTPEPGGLHDAAEQARARMRNRKPTANDLGAAAATGASAFYDASVIGADLFARGVRRFGDWSKIMLKEVGDGIRTLLRKVYDESHRIFNQYKKAGTATAGASAPPRTPPPRAGATATPPDPRAQRPVGERLGARATEAGKRAQKIADTFQALNEKYTTARTHAERVAEKGTIPKEEREGFRKAGQPDKEQTKGFRFSAEDIKQAGAEMVDAVREFRKAEREFTRGADPDSAAAMRTARVVMENAVKRWQVYRSAAGRAVKTFDEPIPASVIGGLREAGIIAGKLKEVKERAPIATNILNGLKNWKNLTAAEKAQFGRDVVDHYRLNLFSVTSWTLDLIGNMSELSGQIGGGLGRDLVFVTRTGDVSFPSMQGLWRAIRAKAPFHPIEKSIEEDLGTSVSGEHLREGERGGTFTYRSNLGSKIYDYVVGGPLYAKGAFDTAAKRLGATWTIYRDAIEAAARRGLKGGDRERFIEDFVNNIPEETRKAAVENGNKAGFNRELTDLEEKVANSTTARLLVDTFARWPFQFTRWAAEMLGYNRPLFDKLRAGTLRPEEVGDYLGKVSVGLGGLYLINQLYDRTDFNSMEYVDDEGNRVRLSNRDPIPSALWFLAVVRGDTAKATTALRYASIPGARLLAGEGGLLGSTVQGFQAALKNPQNDPRALRSEFENNLNRAIPGQAVLGALKTVFDPTIREGIGANLPGISMLNEPAINPVTGGPLKPRQRIAGVELPSISGVPIPGATRVLDPVQKLLSRYGLQVYRGPRSPIAGYPAGQVPGDLQREWTEEFGKARNQLLTPLARVGKALEDRPDEVVRRMIQQRDTAAAKVADAVMRRRHGGPRRLPRQLTQRELAGPNAFRKPS